MSYTPLEVVENNDPSITFTCYDVDSNGSRTTTNLTDAIIECFVKGNPATPDDDAAVTKYSTATGDIAITNPTGGKCRVDFTAAAFIAIKTYYHLDVIRAGRRLTYAHGPIERLNV